MTNCPYCGHKINTSIEVPRMSPREFKIYKLLIQNGRQYTSIAAIMDAISVTKEGTARTAVCNLNKRIAKNGLVAVNLNRVGYRLEEK